LLLRLKRVCKYRCFRAKPQEGFENILKKICEG
jgi:hypothetical protein